MAQIRTIGAMKILPPAWLLRPIIAQSTHYQATDYLGWLFTLGLAGSVWQGLKHAQRAYRAQDKQDKLEEAAWAIGIPAVSAGVYWFSIRIGIINAVWTIGNLPTW